MGYIGAGITRFNTADELTVTGDAQIDTTTLVVDSTNNRVGIGTVSPSKNLHVYHATTNRPALVESGDADALLEFKDSSTTNAPAVGATGNSLIVQTGSSASERMRIDSGGSVGIGTTSPASYGKLAIAGTLATIPDNNGYALLAGRYSSGYPNATLNSIDGVPWVFQQGGTERLRIDSSGNVGIGSSSPRNASGFVGITLDDTSGSFVDFNDSGTRLLTISGNASGSDVNAVTAIPLRFKTNNTERMRIDSNGEFLVGKAAADVTTTGFRVEQAGTTFITRGDNRPLILNRQSSNGNICEFRKANTAVGSIGVDADSTNLMIGNGVVGLRFVAGSNQIRPANIATGGNRDNAIDLGYGSSRFKDLYLSGGVYLGGTGSANELDDYEEGTWTCTLAGASGSTVSVSSQTYTKVGRMVYAAFDFYAKDISGTVGHLRLTGLPFTSNTSKNSHMLIGISATNFDTAWGELGTNSTVIFLYRRSGNGGANFSALTDADWNNNGTSASIRGYIMYLAS